MNKLSQNIEAPHAAHVQEKRGNKMRTLTHTLMLFVLLGLGACASSMSYISPGATLDAGLTKVKGQDISVALSALGPPLGQRESTGRTVYMWEGFYTSQEPIGGPGSVVTDDAIITIPSGLLGSNTVEHRCTIEIMAAPSGIVEYAGYQGDASACRKYADNLSRL